MNPRASHLMKWWIVTFGLVALAGCVQTTRSTRRELVRSDMEWVRPPDGTAAIGGRWRRIPGALAGQLHREVACGIAPVLYQREHTIEVTEPDASAYITAVFGGLSVVLGAFLYSGDNPWPSDEPCRKEVCGLAGAWGFAMMLGGTPYLATGSYFILRGTSQEIVGTRDLPPERGQPQGQARCGEGVVVGLRLMIQTQGQTHATATSDENGEVFLPCPPSSPGR